MKNWKKLLNSYCDKFDKEIHRYERNFEKKFNRKNLWWKKIWKNKTFENEYCRDQTIFNKIFENRRRRTNRQIDKIQIDYFNEN